MNGTLNANDRLALMIGRQIIQIENMADDVARQAAQIEQLEKDLAISIAKSEGVTERPGAAPAPA